MFCKPGLNLFDGFQIRTALEVPTDSADYRPILARNSFPYSSKCDRIRDNLPTIPADFRPEQEIAFKCFALEVTKSFGMTLFIANTMLEEFFKRRIDVIPFLEHLFAQFGLSSFQLITRDQLGNEPRPHGKEELV